MRKRGRSVRNRTIVLKINTYKRLEQYLVELVKRRRTPKVTLTRLSIIC
ncbi:MAG: hypothetical protein NWE91_01965 [Candidatus Bathyarchaeota archaeon]|nr:hypothetical protein [Candidatus Bathyarchaeota archaeon]